MINLPEEIAQKLDAASRRVRKILVLRGLALTVAVFLVVTMLAMVADAYFVIFDDTVRYSISAGVWTATAAALFFALWAPFKFPVSRRRAAKALDERHPENEERLTTVVELVERAEQGDLNTSEALFRVLAREGVICANRVDVLKEFTSRTIVRRLKLLGAVAALLVLSFLVFPNITGLLFVRAALPWIDVGNLYGDYLKVTPGSVAVLKGTTVEIRAELVKKLPGEMMIRISRKQDGAWGKEFAEPLPASGYRETADLAQREWRYRVSCGPAVTKYYTVRVCEIPKYRQFTATLDYPAYTGRRPFAYTNESVGAIHAIEGTRVTFRLDVDEPGTTGELRLSNARGMNLLSDTGLLDGEMVSNLVSSWSMELTSRDGFKSPKRGGPFVSVQDQRPTVVIESPKTRLKLPTHAKLPITFTATDDIGLGAVSVRYAVDGDAMSELRSDPLAGNESFLKRVEEVDLSCFNLLGARQMRVELVVCDRYPAERGGPHSATSTPVIVEFEQNAVSFAEQSLQEQAKECEQALLEAEKRLETAERRAREAREQLRRQGDKKVTEQAEKQIEQLAHEVAETEKRAEELAARLEEDGKFAPVAEKLRAFAQDELAPVAKKVEEAQFADAKERAEALERVQPMLQEAREKMKAAEAELKDRAKALAMHEKTQDLADRQEALATAAKAIMEEKPVDTKKLEAWKRMEEAAAKVAADLAKQDETPELQDARRKMEAAAAEMDRVKAEADIDNDKKLGDEQKASAKAKLAEAAEKAQDAALQKAVQAEKSAVDALQKAVEKREAAAKTQDANQKSRLNAEAANLEKSAAQQQSAAEDQLAKADATDAQQAAQQKASEALAEAAAPEADRLEELKEALAAQREALAQVDAKSPLGDDFKPTDAEAAEAEKRRAIAAALEHLEAAEKAEEQALDALRARDAEAAQKAQETAAAEQKAAREAHAANALEASEKSEAAAAAATERAKQFKNENEFRNALKKQEAALEDMRESVDALKEALGAEVSAVDEQRRLESEADRIRNAQLAAERAERQAAESLKRNDRGATDRQLDEAAVQADRAKGLMEAQRAAAERRDDTEAVEAMDAAIEAQEEAQSAQAAAEAAQEKAFQTKKDEDRVAAEQALEAARAAQSAAGEKMQAAAEQLQQSAAGQQAQGMRSQPEGEQQEPSESSQQESAPSESGQQGGGAQGKPDETAKAAAEDVHRAAERQAAKLGLKALGAEKGSDDAQGSDSAKDDEAKNAQSGGGKNGQTNKDPKGLSLTGGGIRKELEKMARELKSKEAIPEALLDKISTKAWFRIRGSVKEGLGERDLKDIPPEYRDLVRRYFLRLVEEE